MNLDQSLLIWIHQGLDSPWADFLFAYVSSRNGFALPLLLCLALPLVYRHGRDGVKLWLLMSAVVFLGDALGNLIKHLTDQYRPCSGFYQALHHRAGIDTDCGNETHGMPSNHALNFFAAASFLVLTTRQRVLQSLLFAVAVLVGISRIYLGKHFPSQVLAGAVLGMAWGAVTGGLALRYLRFVRGIRRGRERDG